MSMLRKFVKLVGVISSLAIASSSFGYQLDPPTGLSASYDSDADSLEVSWNYYNPQGECDNEQTDDNGYDYCPEEEFCDQHEVLLRNTSINIDYSLGAISCSDTSASLDNVTDGEYKVSIRSRYSIDYYEVDSSSGSAEHDYTDYDWSDYSSEVSVVAGAGITISDADKIEFDKYDLYYGDFNGDGIDGDIYFHGRDLFVLIGIEISIPLLLEGPTSFVIYRYPGSNTGYSNPAQFSVDDSQLGSYTKLSENSDYYRGDLNGDGKKDLLIRGQSSGYSAISLLETNSGAPTSVKVSVDSFDVSSRSNHLQLVDRNNDGRADLVLLSGAGGYPVDTVYTNTSGYVTSSYYVASTVSEMFNVNLKPVGTVGSLGGSFRVNESGASTYAVPIFVPQGTAGVQPSVSLNYSSQASNGVMGHGWSMSFGSSIARCRQTLNTDNKATAITWSQEDRFCLNGQRLLLVSGTYGAANSVYRTEIDSGVIVTVKGVTNGEPNYFTAEAKDGSITYYGLITGDGDGTNSKQSFANGTKTINWYQSVTKDNVGNPIKYYYSQSNGSDFRIREIKYAYGDPAFATSHNASIVFEYEGRPDKIDGYLAGQSLKTTLRLSAVRVFNKVSSKQEIRTYYVTYAKELTGDNRYKPSYVAAIQSCAKNICQPATKFGWDIVSGDYSATSSNNFVFSSEKRSLYDYKLADINGDGVLDLVWLDKWYDNDFVGGSWDTELRYALSVDGSHQKTSFLRPNGTDESRLVFPENLDELIQIEVLDYNVDGRSDVAVYRSRGSNAGEWEVYLSIPASDDPGKWRLSTESIATNVAGHYASFTDFNGDGLTDILNGNKIHYLEPKKTVGLNQSDYESNQFYRFNQSGASIQGFPSLPADYTEDVDTWTVTTNGLTLRYTVSEKSKSFYRYRGAGDFNGDGRSDILLGVVQELNRTQRRVNAVNGVCGAHCSRFYSRELIEHRYAMVRTDAGFEVWKDFGTRNLEKTFNKSWMNDPAQLHELTFDFDDDHLYISDVNADGLTDFLSIAGTAVGAYINNGESLQSLVSLATIGAGSEAQMTDYNQDGYSDLLTFKYSSTLNKNEFKVYLWNPHTAKLELDSTKLLSETDKAAHIYADFTGDGLADHIKIEDYKLNVYPYGSSTGQRDALTTIDSGTGNITEITYDSINNSSHYEGLEIVPAASVAMEQCGRWRTNCVEIYKYSADDFYYALNKGFDLPAGTHTLGGKSPMMELNGAYYVVTEVESTASSSPLANDFTSPHGNHAARSTINLNTKAKVSYYYSEAKIQAGGRGFLGFRSLSTVDEQTGIKTTTVNRQDYPFMGSPQSTIVLAPNGTDVLSESHNTYEIKDWQTSDVSSAQNSGTAGLGPLNIFTAQSYEYKYAFSSNLSLAGALQANTSANSGVLTCVSGANSCPSLTGAHNSQKVAHQVTTQNTIDVYGNTLSTSIENRGDGLSQKVTTINEFGTTETVNIHGTSRSYAEMGRLTKSTVKKVKNGVTEPDRISEFSYYSSGESDGYPGLLKEEKLAPTSSQAYKLTTLNKYDEFGNKTIVSAVGWNGYDAANEERFSESIFDATGRYVEREKNSLGHQVNHVVSRNEYGSPTQVNDINGGIVYSSFDAFNREISTSSNDGNWSTTQYLYCPNASLLCPAEAKTAIVKRHAASGDNIATVSYLDHLGREVRNQSLAFDGKKVLVDTEYDLKGRVVRVSEPYFSDLSSGSLYWTRFYYDVIGQALLTVSADGSTGKAEYEAYSTKTINALNQHKTEISNGLGELVRVEDFDGGEIAYTYNVNGDLVTSTIDDGNSASYTGGSVTGLCQQPTSNLQIILCYDELGRKTQMWDPDKGHWKYEHNAFGELVKQTDANNSYVKTKYDVLGRTISRTDYKSGGSVEGHTAWYYDGVDDQGNIVSNSMLQSTAVIYTEGSTASQCALGSSYCSYTLYDDIGRVDSVQTEYPDGSSYSVSTTYDAIGRVDESTDALDGLIKRNGAFIRSGVKNNYNNTYGYLESVTDLDSQRPLFTPQEFSARGQLLEGKLNDTITVENRYYESTGQIKYKMARLGSTALQDVIYDWDAIGNLKYRNAKSSVLGSGKNLKETFCYDNLNRLIKTISGTLSGSCPDKNGSQTSWDQRYDKKGNLIYKSGVGTYGYGSAGSLQPHAVKSTSGVVNRSYVYDDNGNLETDGSRVIAYSTFDKPTSITRGSHTTEFKYGPSRSRYYRKDSSSSGVTKTWYIGNVEKVVLPNGNIQWRRYADGDALFTYTTNAAGEEISTLKKRYIFKDHLGSTDVITNELGVADGSQPAMSFTEWGERRVADSWADFNSAQKLGFDHSITTKGFTSHEMLDEVGIIHMNGRIYDPQLGRFLQADPFIQAATDTQMYNRYSYLRNNPLNATDPSGYFAQTLLVAAASSAIGYGMAKAGAKTGTAWLGALGNIVTCVGSQGTAAYACAGGFSFGSTYGATGDLGKSIGAGALGAVSAYAFNQIGQHFNSVGNQNMTAYMNGGSLDGMVKLGRNYLTVGQAAQQIGAHALVGGIVADIQGGKFAHGFVSAGVTKSLTNVQLAAANSGGVFAGALTAGAISGTTSTLSGGKFANAAVTGAFQFWFNACKAGKGCPSTKWSFKKLKAGYPKSKGLSGSQVVDRAGGKVTQNFALRNTSKDPIERANWTNTCAARMSYCLNEAGYPVPAPNQLPGDIRVLTSNGNGNYIYGAADMGRYIESQLGTPLVVDKDLSNIKGKTGIIYFENYHIDLWDKKQMIGNTGSVQSYIKNEKAFFWEVK